MQVIDHLNCSAIASSARSAFLDTVIVAPNAVVSEVTPNLERIDRALSLAATIRLKPLTSRRRTHRDILYQAELSREPKRLQLLKLTEITQARFLLLNQSLQTIIITNVMATARCPLRTRVRLPTLCRASPYFPSAPPVAS